MLVGERMSESTAVFCTLGHLLATWRDDPDRLAVVVTAYRLAGYHMEAYEVSRSHDPMLPYISDEEAHRMIQSALHRRNRRKLKHAAEGLLMAVRAMAVEWQAMRLHEVQVASAVIECRERTIEERIEELRRLENETGATGKAGS